MAKWGSSIEDRVKACMEKHPDWPAERVNNSIAGSKIIMIRTIMAGGAVPVESTTVLKPESLVKPELSAYVSLDLICEKLDVKSAIFREIGKIPKNKVIPEAEMISRTAGTDRNRFRRIIENNAEEFRPYRTMVKTKEFPNGSWFWASAEAIARINKLRDA